MKTILLFYNDNNIIDFNVNKIDTSKFVGSVYFISDAEYNAIMPTLQEGEFWFSYAFYIKEHIDFFVTYIKNTPLLHIPYSSYSPIFENEYFDGIYLINFDKIYMWDYVFKIWDCVSDYVDDINNIITDKEEVLQILEKLNY